MPHETILSIEDDEHILELVRFNLAKEGYRVIGVTSAEDALARLRGERPHLILLDIMLPGMNGLEFLKKARKDPVTGSIPVIMLTAKGTEADIVAALELGADDYMVKPFSPRVLVARVKAVLRRKAVCSPGNEAPVAIGNLVIHPGRHEVLNGHAPILLTPTEFKALYYLAQHPGWVFTRGQIMEAAKGEQYVVTDRSIDVMMVGLRKKLGDSGELIETIRGVGYRLREDHVSF